MNHLEQRPYYKDISYKQVVDGKGVTVTDKMLIIPAIVTAVPTDVRELNNSKKTKWRLISVDINHPTLGKKSERAQLFEASFEKFPDSFSKGGEIELMIQTSGDYEGYAKAQLTSSEPIDVSAFKAMLDAVKEEVAETV
jgi:hypothetical protein